jgi:CRISPR-associated protein Cas1
MAATAGEDLDAMVRRSVRGAMVSHHILERMVQDIRSLFDDADAPETAQTEETAPALYLWDAQQGTVANGRSYGRSREEN